MADESLDIFARWGLQSFVKREKLRDRLLKGQPELSAEQKQYAISLFLQSQKLKNAKEVERWMLAEPASEEELKQRAERQLSWQLLCEKRFQSKVMTLFLQRKSQIDQVIYSLLWVKDEALAEELFMQLKEQESSFEKLWKTIERPPKNLSAGKVGPIHLGDLPESLREILRVSQPGQIWPPREAEGGWVLLRLDELQPALFNQGLRRELLMELGDQWLKEQLQQQKD